MSVFSELLKFGLKTISNFNRLKILLNKKNIYFYALKNRQGSMTDDIILKVENVSKQYRLGTIGTGTISHDLNRWWHSIRGKEDPYLKIGETNDRATKGTSDYVWALQDINFEVKRGEVLGIIGKNGAGKSTLLKILSRVTTPTTGSMKSRGRIAALLEVGTGFNPELTGRENIYLNGAILGMTKKEISSKLDEIIEFSGCERYIDTPTKRYSSGMNVRLGFAVAAFLEPEILIVDEVLAVGDAEFQKKALGKMQDVSKNDGRTVLFVSHNMAAVRSLCTRGIVLKNGMVVHDGHAIDAVSYYLSGNSETLNKVVFEDEYNNEWLHLKEIKLSTKEKADDEPLDEYDEIDIITRIEIKKNPEVLHLTYVLKNSDGETLFTITTSKVVPLKLGLNELVCHLPKAYLNINSYYLDLYIIKDSKTSVFTEKDIMHFSIVEGQRAIGGWMGREPGIIKPKFDWSII
jgi:lipopolysaccharide transport system ATP-binding protein